LFALQLLERRAHLPQRPRKLRRTKQHEEERQKSTGFAGYRDDDGGEENEDEARPRLLVGAPQPAAEFHQFGFARFHERVHRRAATPTKARVFGSRRAARIAHQRKVSLRRAGGNGFRFEFQQFAVFGRKKWVVDFVVESDFEEAGALLAQGDGQFRTVIEELVGQAELAPKVRAPPSDKWQIADHLVTESFNSLRQTRAQVLFVSGHGDERRILGSLLPNKTSTSWLPPSFADESVCRTRLEFVDENSISVSFSVHL